MSEVELLNEIIKKMSLLFCLNTVFVGVIFLFFVYVLNQMTMSILEKLDDNANSDPQE
jgi:hypothetical protein